MIIIQDYDPAWPAIFEALRLRAAAALGSIATAIEHVGSTAVPGLAAKPIIDMDVLLESKADFPVAIARLARIGYEHQGDLGITGREAFKSPAGDVPHNLYVCMPDSTEYWRHLAFRDYLRKHPDEAEEYASLKRRVAIEFASDRDGYSRAKGPFTTKILSLSKSQA